MEEFFFSLRKKVNTQRLFIDASYIRCHQHASGARRGEDRAIGPSRGGRTTKIHLCCDADGYPIYFEITGGEVHDSEIAQNLIEAMGEGEYLIADKGYNAKKIRQTAQEHGMKPVIPSRKTDKQPNPHFDKKLYGFR